METQFDKITFCGKHRKITVSPLIHLLLLNTMARVFCENTAAGLQILLLPLHQIILFPEITNRKTSADQGGGGGENELFIWNDSSED